MKKKIFLLAVSFFVFLYSIFRLIFTIRFEYCKNHYEKYDPHYIGELSYFLYSKYSILFLIFFLIVVMLLSLYIIINILKNANIKNHCKYTYEEYHQLKENEKADRIQKKKAKLQQQLNELEKTE